MKILSTACVFSLLLLATTYCTAQKKFSISTETLKDKIKGGWAGQTIGVTYGAPVEFRYLGTMINDYQKLEWYDGLMKNSMIKSPGIYDDLYMDITFVEVFDKEGLDAPVSSHANAFANAGYMLWHANQAARYNILNGVPAPESGHWLNNPHADCIDYQIESDFAGLMSPAMPNAASEISKKIGHIMNYGDGWYGGVYVGAMYALAFTSKDINYIVSEALSTIPVNTTFNRCISDVIRWHKLYPNDWKRTWFEIQKKWTDDIGCPEGVFAPFNIDAKVNAAYVVLGLLYGNEDFGKSIEIAARAGQDADCNPSTVAGVLGTMLGYDKIPVYWKMGLKEIEDMDFKYTHTSLNKVYEMSYKHAIGNIKRNGGTVNADKIVIETQQPKAVEWEQSFTDLKPVDKKWIGKTLDNEYEFEFTGDGFVIAGEYRQKKGTVDKEGNTATATVELHIDGRLNELIKLPVSFTVRRHEIAWKYQLENGKHTVKLKLLNPDNGSECLLSSLLIYSKK
jgi:hypothetical protein